MRRISDAIVSILFLFVLFGPIVLLETELTSINLPSWITSEDAKYLSGGKTDGNIKANLTIEGFTSKNLQNALEIEIQTHC